MSLEIIFAPNAKSTLFSTISFIENYWGKSTSEKFKKRVDIVLQNISKQPYIFKAISLDENVRQGFVTKQCSVFYQIHPNYIEVLFFWDNRQEPIL